MRRTDPILLPLLLTLSLASACDRSKGEDMPVVQIGVDAGASTTGSNGPPDAGVPASPAAGAADPSEGPRGEVARVVLDRWPRGVEDGDTLGLKGGRQIRLLNIDTEEKFSGDERAEASRDWQGYITERARERPLGKYGTPMGDQARRFARRFFEPHHRRVVHLEFGDAHHSRDYVGRELGYIWVRDGDRWTNYNLELVRQGLSPYFTNYGYSPRYHEAFLAAEQEARDEGRGIWARDARAYPDYEARIAHWRERADQIRQARRRFEGHRAAVELDHDQALDRLRALDGQPVVVFGELVDLDPRGLLLAHRQGKDVLVEGKGLHARARKLGPRALLYASGQVALDEEGHPRVLVDDPTAIRSPADPPPLP